MIFAIPRGKVTYIGTSDTNYKGDLDHVRCSVEDAEYILKNINNIFNIDPLVLGDISSSWAGLRPLIHEEGKSPSELSRTDEIFISESNLISIAGGKLTGYRKMAKRIVDLIQERHPDLSSKACQTKNFKIHVNSFADYKDYLQFKNEMIEKYGKGEDAKIEVEYLCSCYGQSAKQILMDTAGSKLAFYKAVLKSELNHVLQNESARHPLDFIVRRSGRLFFDINSVKENLDFIIQEFAVFFSWPDNQKASTKKDCETVIFEANNFK